jgi:hypothetical protein
VPALVKWRPSHPRLVSAALARFGEREQLAPSLEAALIAGIAVPGCFSCNHEASIGWCGVLQQPRVPHQHDGAFRGFPDVDTASSIALPRRAARRPV